MRGAAVGVDVVAVGSVVDDIGLGAERIEYALGDHPRSAVGNVQTDLDALEAVFAHGNQVADIAVSARHIVNGSADFVARSNGDFELVVNIFLDLEQRLLLHLLALAVEQLDAVVVVGVVRSGDHNAAVEVVDAGDIRHGGRGGHVHDVCVGAACHQAGAERVFKHIGRTACVLADNDLCFFAHVGAVIPTEKTSDLDSMLKGQVLVRLASKAVGTKIFAHHSAVLSTMSPLFLKMQFSGITPRTQEVG